MLEVCSFHCDLKFKLFLDSEEVKTESQRICVACYKARQLAEQAHVTARLVGGLSNLAAPQTEKGRECKKAKRLPAQHVHLQSGEKVQEFIRFGEEVGQFSRCAVGNQLPLMPLHREGRKCLQLSQRKWKAKALCVVFVHFYC